MSDDNQRRQAGKFIDEQKPRFAFYLGLLGGLGVMFAVGFFILLGLYTGDGEGKTAKNTNTGPALGVAAPSPTPSAPTPTPGNVNVAAVTSDDWVMGDRNAKVSIIEFSDYSCPFCTRVHPTIQQIVDDYDGDVNWVFRHFPLTSIHPSAQRQAEGAECAGELGGNDGFWAYTDAIFGGGISDPSQAAAAAGVDAGDFTECLNSGRQRQAVQSDAAQATAAGGRGTPYSIVVAGDQRIPVSGAVPIDRFTSIIDPLL